MSSEGGPRWLIPLRNASTPRTHTLVQQARLIVELDVKIGILLMLLQRKALEGVRIVAAQHSRGELGRSHGVSRRGDRAVQ